MGATPSALIDGRLMDETTDLPDELVARAAGDDREALSELLARLGPQVHQGLQIAAIWRASLDAADVMQTTYLEVFLRIGQLEQRTVAGFRRWMTRIAENNLRDAIRGLERARRPDPRRRVTVRTPEDSCQELLEQLGHTTHTASRELQARETVTLLHAALSRLPPSYRLVVERLDLEGHPAADVAAAMERSTGAVYMLRARAHDRLRELLGPQTRLFTTRPTPEETDGEHRRLGSD
jgi:RNA polymerase sigma factor (sigma-70 family)